MSKIVETILKNRGKNWAESNCGMTEANTPNDIAQFVYYDFLDSEAGKRAWEQGGQDEEKVDYIFDEMYTTYVTDGGLMTDEEWSKINDSLYEMVYEGVF
jgi:hypothetical protein